tara:strand:+ start:5764 stop:5979 length:216 start_codon:yes stop_codon:yes gene_type:complete
VRSKETPKKSIVKTISWEIWHFVVLAGILYLFTGEWEYAGLGAIAYIAIESLGYYVHERIWARVSQSPKKK